MARITMSCREIEIGEYLLEPIIRAVPQVSDIPPFNREQLVTPDEADATIILGELESVTLRFRRRSHRASPRERPTDRPTS